MDQCTWNCLLLQAAVCACPEAAPPSHHTGSVGRFLARTTLPLALATPELLLSTACCRRARPCPSPSAPSASWTGAPTCAGAWLTEVFVSSAYPLHTLLLSHALVTYLTKTHCPHCRTLQTAGGRGGGAGWHAGVAAAAAAPIPAAALVAAAAAGAAGAAPALARGRGAAGAGGGGAGAAAAPAPRHLAAPLRVPKGGRASRRAAGRALPAGR